MNWKFPCLITGLALLTPLNLALSSDSLTQAQKGEIIEIRGIGEADVSNTKKATDLELETARDNAVIQAISKALANQSDNLRQQFAERARPNMEAVRKMLFDARYGSADILAEERKVRISLVASFDLNKLKDGLNAWSKSTSQVNRSDTEVVIFFTARATTSTEAFDATLKSGREDGVKEDTLGTRAQVEGGVTGTDAKITTSRTEIKSSTVQQADKLTYELDPSSGDSFGTGLMGQFTDKGFEQMIPGSLFEEVSKAFDEVKAGGGKPSLKHWGALKEELEGEEAIRYVITGFLDYSQPRQDSISGMWRVDASVSGEIYDISKRIPRLVAALEQKTESAVAPSQEAAKKRAVEAMAPLAADEIISKLKNNNVID